MYRNPFAAYLNTSTPRAVSHNIQGVCDGITYLFTQSVCTASSNHTSIVLVRTRHSDRACVGTREAAA